MEEAKLIGKKYQPRTFENGDTKKELLARSQISSVQVFREMDRLTETES